jgi:hypothetical protein
MFEGKTQTFTPHQGKYFANLLACQESSADHKKLASDFKIKKGMI